MKPRIYIAGPMTGLPDSNYPAFNAAAATWRAMGWDVENPAEHFGGAQDRKYYEYVDVDVDMLKTCDAVAMLPGWRDGHSGAIWEETIARKLLGVPVLDATRPVAPDSVDLGAQILVANYDEWREFQRWRQSKAAVVDLEYVPPRVQDFIDNVLPISRHHVTGALGRWINGQR